MRVRVRAMLWPTRTTRQCERRSGRHSRMSRCSRRRAYGKRFPRLRLRCGLRLRRVRHAWPCRGRWRRQGVVRQCVRYGSALRAVALVRVAMVRLTGTREEARERWVGTGAVGVMTRETGAAAATRIHNQAPRGGESNSL